MFTAIYKYNSATRILSLRLRDMEEAKSDQYFMAIMLLGLYEVIKCIHQHTSVPPFITEWSQPQDFETIEQASITALSLLVIRYADLRASMSSFQDYSDPERIISTAYALECDFASWVKSIPLEYIYQTINLSERVNEVYSDHYHVYSSIRVATTWNHYRCARLLANEIILDQLSHLYETSPTSPFLTSHSCYSERQILESNATLMHLCEDICASVPYYMGSPYNTGPGSVRQLPKALHANLIIWPLFTTNGNWRVSDLMINWVAGRLQWIADVMGIRQAAPQAAFLRGKKRLLTWNSSWKIDDTHIRETDDSEAGSPPTKEYVFLEFNKKRVSLLSS
ncbi:hypothetical protein N431DRAFT_553032 [Stipitochalara longipes BDJ]|nr:hypothetical protein N431DRAFT_553032 [Stipitochalara longipes BDJ]